MSAFRDVAMSNIYSSQVDRSPKREVLCGPAGEIARNLISVNIFHATLQFLASRDPFLLEMPFFRH